HRLGQVQAAAVALEPLDHAQRLLVVPEAAAEACLQHDVERLLTGVSEWRMSEVVAVADRLGEVLVQAQRAGNRPGDAARFKRMGEPRAVVIALRSDEDL